ncbi:hypothetical protein WDU94_010611 [Cyamophila willieti]
MDTLEIHIESDSGLLDEINHINAVVINSDEVSSEFIQQMDGFDSEVKSPMLQSFDVFCDPSDLAEQEASVFSLDNESDGNLILVADQDEDDQLDSNNIMVTKLETPHHPMEGQVVQLEDGALGVLTFDPNSGNDQLIKLPDGTIGYLLTSQLDSINKIQHTDDNQEYIVVELDDGDLDRDDEILFEMEGEPDDVMDVMEEGKREEEGGAKKEAGGGGGAGEPNINNVCPECQKVFSSPHHMKVHMRIHSGVRPFKCPVEYCEKAFATQYSRKAHIRTHTGEKPYRCAHAHCAKSFKTSGDLQKHVRTHTGERPFPCTVPGCNRSFTTSNIRKVHIRTHTGEKPYVCPEQGCDKSFASATNYKNHMRIHSGEKPYVCQVRDCQKRFTEYSSLYKHTLVHSDERPFICEDCPRSYRQLCTLNVHKKTYHPKRKINVRNDLIKSKMTKPLTPTTKLVHSNNTSSLTIINTADGSAAISNNNNNATEKYFLMELTIPSIPHLKADNT